MVGEHQDVTPPYKGDKGGFFEIHQQFYIEQIFKINL